jgi:phage shock protein A
MKTIDVLETKIKEALEMKAKLEDKQKHLVEEIEQLKSSVNKLEMDRERTKQTIDMIIEKVELYLKRAEV